MDRRSFLRGGAVAAGVMAVGGSVWTDALAAPLTAQPGDSPYGPLLAPDRHGVHLPTGFASRVLARTGATVGRTYVWHGAPDGGAVFPTDVGGWVYVSNSEIGNAAGGAGAIRFAANGAIETAYRILRGTNRNCSGGATPWNRWLSCEETDRGYVFECDPYGRLAAVRRPAMGRFKHEAAAVDPVRKVVYMTEDERDGCFYRFRPTRFPDLSAGVLEVACPGGTPDAVVWKRVPDPLATSVVTRNQVAGARRFNGGEGAHYDRDVCYFTTKGDNRVWGYDAARGVMTLVYAPDLVTAGTPVLRGVDNVTVSRLRDVYVAEDGDNLEINMIRGGIVSPVVRLVGHDGSEIAGVAFNPAGDRMYFSSQRGTNGLGITYEVRGPF